MLILPLKALAPNSATVRQPQLGQGNIGIELHKERCLTATVWFKKHADWVKPVLDKLCFLDSAMYCRIWTRST